MTSLTRDDLMQAAVDGRLLSMRDLLDTMADQSNWCQVHQNGRCWWAWNGPFSPPCMLQVELRKMDEHVERASAEVLKETGDSFVALAAKGEAILCEWVRGLPAGAMEALLATFEIGYQEVVEKMSAAIEEVAKGKYPEMYARVWTSPPAGDEEEVASSDVEGSASNELDLDVVQGAVGVLHAASAAGLVELKSDDGKEASARKKMGLFRKHTCLKSGITHDKCGMSDLACQDCKEYVRGFIYRCLGCGRQERLSDYVGEVKECKPPCECSMVYDPINRIPIPCEEALPELPKEVAEKMDERVDAWFLETFGPKKPDGPPPGTILIAKERKRLRDQGWLPASYTPEAKAFERVRKLMVSYDYHKGREKMVEWLAKVGALIAVEIDRVNRHAVPADEPPGEGCTHDKTKEDNPPPATEKSHGSKLPPIAVRGGTFVDSPRKVVLELVAADGSIIGPLPLEPRLLGDKFPTKRQANEMGMSFQETDTACVHTPTPRLDSFNKLQEWWQEVVDTDIRKAKKPEPPKREVEYTCPECEYEFSTVTNRPTSDLEKRWCPNCNELLEVVKVTPKVREPLGEANGEAAFLDAFKLKHYEELNAWLQKAQGHRTCRKCGRPGVLAMVKNTPGGKDVYLIVCPTMRCGQRTTDYTSPEEAWGRWDKVNHNTED